MNKILNNESGIALIMVIILVVAVGALVGALMISELSNISFTDREINETKSFYLAEAGVQRVEALFDKQGKVIFEDNNSLTGDNDKFINDKNQMSLDTQDGSYQIMDIEKIESDKIVKIEILGKYNNTKKLLGVTIDLANDIDLDGLFSNALFVAGNNNGSSPSIKMSGSSKIIGDVKTNLSDFNLIKVHNNTKSGSIYDNFSMYYDENIKEDKKAGDEEWNLENSPYEKGDVVWHDGFYYEAINGTDSFKPGTNEVWQIMIPNNEIWQWFKYKKYNKGQKVWFENQLYYITKPGVFSYENPNESDKWTKYTEGFNNGINYSEELNYPEAIFPDFDEVKDPNQISTSKQSNIIGRVIDNNGKGLENVDLYLNIKDKEVESQDWGSIGKFTFYSIKGTVIITPVKKDYRFEPESIEVTHPSDEIIFKAIPKDGKTYDKNNINTSESLKYKITGEEKYDEINIANEVPLVIDMEEGDKTITVNALNINGDIELINAAEDSQLTINVAEKFNLKGSGGLNPTGNTKNVEVFYKGNKALNIGGGTELNGNLFVEKADLSFTAGSSIKGQVISNGKNVEISGGTNVTSRVIYAPEADVNLIGGGKVKGSLIANTFTASGGTKLEYDDDLEIDQDFFEDILDFGNNSGNNSSNDGENKITWYNKQD